MRTLYIHPDNFPEGILPIMAADPRLVPYFDLPFQHGSERILKKMNRRGSAEAYLELIGRIRGLLPDAAIRSTFLVGFPGETDEDFTLLRAFQDAARLDWVGSFAYSREEGTAAYGMAARVPKKTVAARRRELEEAQGAITASSSDASSGASSRCWSKKEWRQLSTSAAPGDLEDFRSEGRETRRPRWTASRCSAEASSQARSSEPASSRCTASTSTRRQ